MWRISLALIIGGIAALVFGGHKLMVAMRNSSPVQMKYADWRKAPPDSEWLELSDVHIDWSASARIDTQHTRKGVVTSTDHDYYVACWASDDDPEPVCAFLHVDDADKQQLMEQCWDHDGDDAWLTANIDRVYEVKTVRGLVQTGLDLSSEDQKLLRDMGHVQNDFRIIELNKEPEGGFGAILIVVGILCVLGGGATFFVGRKKPGKPHYPPTGYTNAPPPGHGHMPPPGAMPPAAPNAMQAGPARMPGQRPAPRPPQPGPGPAGPRPVRPPQPRPPQV
ncbi:MAG: hypothetical protein H6839_01250 [Planctomycetes bacterium]|nr:hypothetical protein [Planctomycetota bacterium]